MATLFIKPPARRGGKRHKILESMKNYWLQGYETMMIWNDYSWIGK